MRSLIRGLWVKWQTSRMFCGYCREIAVPEPGMYCSAACKDYAMLENLAA